MLRSFGLCSEGVLTSYQVVCFLVVITTISQQVVTDAAELSVGVALREDDSEIIRDLEKIPHMHSSRFNSLIVLVALVIQFHRVDALILPLHQFSASLLHKSSRDYWTCFKYVDEFLISVQDCSEEILVISKCFASRVQTHV